MTDRLVMTAAFIERHGGPDVIRVGDLPVPAPGPTDVLVRTLAMAVNHVDTFVRSGAYRTLTPFPFVIGRDLVGQVVRAGAGVGGFEPGDAVWCNSLGHHGRQGSFSELAVVPADRLYRLPAGADPVEAVSVLHTGGTAYLGLVREGSLRLGDTVVVGGGAGGVGSAAIQLAHAVGARVVATASAGDGDWCRAIGADEVLDYRDPALADRIAALAPQGVDLYWDTSGHQDLSAVVPLLATGSRLVVSAGIDASAALPTGQLYRRDASVRGFAISNAPVSDLAAAARTVNALLARGALRNRIGAVLPLSQAPQAHRLQEGAGQERPPGRIVVVPDQDPHPGHRRPAQP